MKCKISIALVLWMYVIYFKFCSLTPEAQRRSSKLISTESMLPTKNVRLTLNQTNTTMCLNHDDYKQEENGNEVEVPTDERRNAAMSGSSIQTTNLFINAGRHNNHSNTPSSLRTLTPNVHMSNSSFAKQQQKSSQATSDSLPQSKLTSHLFLSYNNSSILLHRDNRIVKHTDPMGTLYLNKQKPKNNMIQSIVRANNNHNKKAWNNINTIMHHRILKDYKIQHNNDPREGFLEMNSSSSALLSADSAGASLGRVQRESKPLNSEYYYDYDDYLEDSHFGDLFLNGSYSNLIRNNTPLQTDLFIEKKPRRKKKKKRVKDNKAKHTLIFPMSEEMNEKVKKRRERKNRLKSVKLQLSREKCLLIDDVRICSDKQTSSNLAAGGNDEILSGKNNDRFPVNSPSTRVNFNYQQIPSATPYMSKTTIAHITTDYTIQAQEIREHNPNVDSVHRSMIRYSETTQRLQSNNKSSPKIIQTAYTTTSSRNLTTGIDTLLAPAPDSMPMPYTAVPVYNNNNNNASRYSSNDFPTRKHSITPLTAAPIYYNVPIYNNSSQTRKLYHTTTTNSSNSQTRALREKQSSSSTTSEDKWPIRVTCEVPGDIILGALMMVHERDEKLTCGKIMPQGT